MNFLTEQSALTTALDHIRGIVPKRNTIPIIANTLVTTTADGITLTATDLDIEVTETVAAEVSSPGAVTVPAHMLSDIVRKMPKGSQVKIETGGTTASVAAGRSRFELATLPREDFPVMAADQGGTTFTMSAAELRDLIGRVLPTMSTEETRFYLNGFYLHNSDGALRAVSTDGHRLTRYDASMPDGADGIPGVIVPRMTASVLAGLLRGADGDVSVTVTDTKIIAVFGGVRLVSKLIDGIFPDYQRVIPSGNSNRLTMETKVLAAAVDRAGVVFTEGGAVKLTLSESGLTLSARAGTAESVEGLEAEYVGTPMEIGFNHRYLVGMLGGITGDTVSIAMSDAGSPTIITDPSEEGVLYVLMPMRV